MPLSAHVERAENNRFQVAVGIVYCITSEKSMQLQTSVKFDALAKLTRVRFA